jgi:hypothetical protein
MKTLIATATTTMMLLGAGSAFAQDDMGGDPMPTATGGAEPQMGLETEFNGVGDLPAIHMLYNLGGNYLDLVAGVGFDNTSPETGDSVTDFTLVLGAGYRMYKDMDGRIHPYLEPFAQFALISNGDDADPDITSFGAGAMLGVDFMVFDQFTLGAAFGAGLDYTMVKDVANTLSVGVFTTSLNATLWWG